MSITEFDFRTNNKSVESYLPAMISVTEFQHALGIGKDKAYQIAREKDFPSIKIGKEYKIFLEKLPDWLSKQEKYKNMK